MKVYIFDCQCGTVYYVLAESEEDALMYVKKFLKEVVDADKAPYKAYHEEILKKWKDATVDNLPDGYPSGYSIIVRGVGEVDTFETE